jgi:hypothetical protein
MPFLALGGVTVSHTPDAMPSPHSALEDVLISVWRQALLEHLPVIVVDGRKFRVTQTSRSKLREVDFEFQGQTLRGLEQNPNTNSRWAQLARGGKKVMQFLSSGRYIANVVDGKVQIYDHARRG